MQLQLDPADTQVLLEGDLAQHPRQHDPVAVMDFHMVIISCT